MTKPVIHPELPPRLAAGVDVSAMRLSVEEAFCASAVNGYSTIDDIATMTGMTYEQTKLVLERLRGLGVLHSSQNEPTKRPPRLSVTGALRPSRPPTPIGVDAGRIPRRPSRPPHPSVRASTITPAPRSSHVSMPAAQPNRLSQVDLRPLVPRTSSDPNIRRSTLPHGQSQPVLLNRPSSRPISAPPGGAARASGMFAEAKGLLDRGQRTEALNMARMALAYDRQNRRYRMFVQDLERTSTAPSITVDELLEHGARALALNHPRKAERFFERAVKLEPDNPRSRIRLASTLLLNDDDPDEALEQAQRAVKAGRTVAEAHYVLARCYERVGKTDRAIESYEVALRLRPDYREASKRLDKALAGGTRRSKSFVSSLFKRS